MKHKQKIALLCSTFVCGSLPSLTPDGCMADLIAFGLLIIRTSIFSIIWTLFQMLKLHSSPVLEFKTAVSHLLQNSSLAQLGSAYLWVGHPQ